MSFYTNLVGQLQHSFQHLGPRVQRSVHQGLRKRPPEWVSDMGELVVGAGMLAQALVHCKVFFDHFWLRESPWLKRSEEPQYR